MSSCFLPCNSTTMGGWMAIECRLGWDGSAGVHDWWPWLAGRMGKECHTTLPCSLFSRSTLERNWKGATLWRLLVRRWRDGRRNLLWAALFFFSLPRLWWGPTPDAEFIVVCLCSTRLLLTRVMITIMNNWVRDQGDQRALQRDQLDRLHLGQREWVFFVLCCCVGAYLRIYGSCGWWKRIYAFKYVEEGWSNTSEGKIMYSSVYFSFLICRYEATRWNSTVTH